jgi:hypothetical protein
MMCKAEEGSRVCLPGSEIPNWFSHQTTGSLISFRVPSFVDGEIRRILYCVVFAANKDTSFVDDDLRHDQFSITYRNKTRNIQSSPRWMFSDYLNISEDHIFVEAEACEGIDGIGLEFDLESGDEIEVSVEGTYREVKKLGIHLLFDDLEMMPLRVGIEEYDGGDKHTKLNYKWERWHYSSNIFYAIYGSQNGEGRLS